MKNWKHSPDGSARKRVRRRRTRRFGREALRLRSLHPSDGGGREGSEEKRVARRQRRRRTRRFGGRKRRRSYEFSNTTEAKEELWVLEGSKLIEEKVKRSALWLWLMCKCKSLGWLVERSTWHQVLRWTSQPKHLWIFNIKIFTSVWLDYSTEALDK